MLAAALVSAAGLLVTGVTVACCKAAAGADRQSETMRHRAERDGSYLTWLEEQFAQDRIDQMLREDETAWKRRP